MDNPLPSLSQDGHSEVTEELTNTLPQEEVVNIEDRKPKPNLFRTRSSSESDLSIDVHPSNRERNISGHATSSTGSRWSSRASGHQTNPEPGYARLTSEQKEILSVLSHNPTALPTLQIGNTLSRQTKADVNPNLEELLKECSVEQVGKDPPTWTATSTCTEDCFSSHFKEFFRPLDMLGEGGFGKVLKAEHKLDKQIYAVKMIPIKKDKKIPATQECIILAKLEHPNIVQYKSSWTDQEFFDRDEDEEDSSEGASGDKLQKSPGRKLECAELERELDSKGDVLSAGGTRISMEKQAGDREQFYRLHHILCIQMELCDMSLHQQLAVPVGSEPVRNIDVSWNKHVFTEIMEGLEYIHGKDIIHKDLTTLNIFLCMPTPDCLKVKIGDFGLSRDLGEAGALQLSSKGAFLYRAPELGSQRKCDTRVDMFSLAVILCEMFSSFGSESERSKELCMLKPDPQDPQRCKAKVREIFAQRSDLNSEEAVRVVCSCLGDHDLRPMCVSLKVQMSKVWQV